MSVIEKIELSAEQPPEPRSFLEQAGEIDLREMLRKLWRQRRVFVGTVFLLTALAAIITIQMTPIYRADALVMVAPPKAKVLNIESIVAGLPFDSDTINSEIAIIRSRRLAGRVVAKLDLAKDPEFNRKLRPNDGLLGWLQGLAKTKPATLSPEAAAARARANVVNEFQLALEVQPVFRSRVIAIRVESTDPNKAAQLANTVADLYLLDQLEAKFEATQRATNWLNERLTQLRKAVDLSERAVEAYRREARLVKGKDDVSIASQQISELSSQLIVARTKRAEAEARLSQIERLLKSGRGVNSAAEVLSSPLIQRLRERESQVIGKMAELSAEYGRKHPKLIAVRAEINDLRRKIRAEVRKIIEGVRSEVQIARVREQSMTASLTKLESRIADLNKKSVRLRALDREAKANRALLDTVLSRFKETTAQSGIQSPDARIISRAVPPTKAAAPNIRLSVGLTFVGACILGLFLVFLIERLDAGFRSMEQIEHYTGFSALGLEPELDSRDAKKTPPEQYVLDNPVSAFAESVRNLHVSIALSNVDRPPKVVLFTSASPEEGKSSLSVALGRVVARSGKKVIILDCDLRRPTLHTRLGMAEKPGLIELLAGQASLDEVVQRDDASGADFVPAGEHAPNPVDLLSSEHMKTIVETLSTSYDLVVMDCSPVLAVSDARVLTRLADKTVFVVRWVKTRRESAILALKQLKEAGGDIAGVVLSRVDVKKHAGYGYADSGYYHGKYAKYYTGR